MIRQLNIRLHSHSRRLLWSGQSPKTHKDWMSEYMAMPTQGRENIIFEEIGKVTGPKVGEFPALISALNTTSGSAPFAISLRGDILRLRHSLMSRDTTGTEAASLAALDRTLKNWLSVFLSSDALFLNSVTFSKSSGSILEFIAQNEGVHSVKTLSELKNRLSLGKRCFALFHSNYKNDPLAFIHVAFTSSISRSMSELEESSFECGASISDDGVGSLMVSEEGGQSRLPGRTPTCAMFYSVNSPQDALSGLNMASRVIDRVTEEISCRIPSVNTFCTLSPVPGFLGYLRSSINTGIESSIFESIPKGLVVDVMRHLGDSTGDMSIRGSADFKSTAFRVLLEFLEEVNKNSLMHLSIATESTADVVSISNIHRSRNEPSLSADSMMSFQKEMTDMYQQEQTKILRFAHLADETVSYDSHLKEVHIIPLSREDSTGEGSSKTLSNISVKRLREIWQGLKAPILWLCHAYLLNAKHEGSSDPADPVARFHLRNGASLHQINWGACVEDPRLLSQSAGIMVNYLYEAEHQNNRRATFAKNGEFHVNDDVIKRYRNCNKGDCN